MKRARPPSPGHLARLATAQKRLQQQSRQGNDGGSSSGSDGGSGGSSRGSRGSGRRGSSSSSGGDGVGVGGAAARHRKLAAAAARSSGSSSGEETRKAEDDDAAPRAPTRPVRQASAASASTWSSSDSSEGATADRRSKVVRRDAPRRAAAASATASTARSAASRESISAWSSSSDSDSSRTLRGRARGRGVSSDSSFARRPADRRRGASSSDSDHDKSESGGRAAQAAIRARSHDLLVAEAPGKQPSRRSETVPPIRRDLASGASSVSRGSSTGSGRGSSTETDSGPDAGARLRSEAASAEAPRAKQGLSGVKPQDDVTGKDGTPPPRAPRRRLRATADDRFANGSSRGRRSANSDAVSAPFGEWRGEASIIASAAHVWRSAQHSAGLFDVLFDRGQRWRRSGGRRKPFKVTVRGYDVALEVARNYSVHKAHGVRACAGVFEAFWVRCHQLVSLGTFASALEAAEAHDRAVLEHQSGGVLLRGVLNFEDRLELMRGELEQVRAARRVLDEVYGLWREPSGPGRPRAAKQQRRVEGEQGQDQDQDHQAHRPHEQRWQAPLEARASELARLGEALLEQGRWDEAGRVGAALSPWLGRAAARQLVGAVSVVMRGLAASLLKHQRTAACQRLLAHMMSELRGLHGLVVSQVDVAVHAEFVRRSRKLAIVFDRQLGLPVVMRNDAAAAQHWRALRVQAVLLFGRVAARAAAAARALPASSLSSASPAAATQAGAAAELRQALAAIQEEASLTTMRTAWELPLLLGCMRASDAMRGAEPGGGSGGPEEHARLSALREAERDLKAAQAIAPGNAAAVACLVDVQLEIILRVGVSSTQEASQSQGWTLSQESRGSSGGRRSRFASDASDASSGSEGEREARMRQSEMAANHAGVRGVGSTRDTFELVQELCVARPRSPVGFDNIARLLQVQLDMTDEGDTVLYSKTLADLRDAHAALLRAEPFRADVLARLCGDGDRRRQPAPRDEAQLRSEWDIIVPALCESIECLTLDQCPPAGRLLPSRAALRAAFQARRARGEDVYVDDSLEDGDADHLQQQHQQQDLVAEDEDVDVDDRGSRVGASSWDSTRPMVADDLLDPFADPDAPPPGEDPRYPEASRLWARLAALPKRALAGHCAGRAWWRARFFLGCETLDRKRLELLLALHGEAGLVTDVLTVGIKLGLVTVTSSNFDDE